MCPGSSTDSLLASVVAGVLAIARLSALVYGLVTARKHPPGG